MPHSQTNGKPPTNGMAPRKRGPGQPTKYDPTYHPRRLVELFETHPLESHVLWWTDVEREFGVCDDTLLAWEQRYPEFLAARKRALALQERHLVLNCLAGRTNPAMTIFTLKNKHHWRDSHELSGPGGEPFKLIISEKRRGDVTNLLGLPAGTETNGH